MKTVKTLGIKLTEYDVENIEVAMILNPSIRSMADLLRSGVENILESGSTAEQVALARRNYRKAQREAQA